MVNRVVVDYLRNYGGKYRIEDLTKKILAAGYSEEDVEEALIALNLKKPSEIGRTPLASSEKTFSFKPSATPPEGFFRRISKRDVLVEKKQQEKSSVKKLPPTSFSRRLKIGASFGIFLIFLMILLLFFCGGVFWEVYLWSPLVLILLFLILISFILFFYGFFTLGERYDSGLMKVASLGFVAFLLLLMVFGFLLMIFPEVIGDFLFGSLRESSTSQIPSLKEIYNGLTTDYFSLFIVMFICTLISSFLNILLGVALFRLKKQVEYAKITSILMIIGGALLILGVGALALIVALILGIILLFKASKNL